MRRIITITALFVCALSLGCSNSTAGGSSSETYTVATVRFDGDTIRISSSKPCHVVAHDSGYIPGYFRGYRTESITAENDTAALFMPDTLSRTVTLTDESGNHSLFVRESDRLDLTALRIDTLKEVASLKVRFDVNQFSLPDSRSYAIIRGTDWYTIGTAASNEGTISGIAAGTYHLLTIPAGLVGTNNTDSVVAAVGTGNLALTIGAGKVVSVSP